MSLTRHLLLFVVLVCGTYGLVDYCAVNKFNTNSTYLQFTKEISSEEYAIAGAFKSLHCCAKGYRSIEWYKDGRPYPWPGGVSHFILYPESANQTIYAQKTSLESDGGNYSCLVRNDTTEKRHMVTLTVMESVTYSGTPLPTYVPKDVVVQLGDDARFFCEAFVGHIPLPDAHSAISWWKDNSSEFLNQHRVSQMVRQRENKQILGSHLFIRGVRREDLGKYTCRITNLDLQPLDLTVSLRETEVLLQTEPARTTARRTLKLVCIALLIPLLLIVLYLQFGLQLRLFCRDSLCRPDHNDGKQYDALLCYEEHDAEFVLGVLLPTLENRYNYTCIARCLPPHDNRAIWNLELAGAAENSRRLVVVLSPALLGNKWTSTCLHEVLSVLHGLHPALVCVALQSLPKNEFVKGESGCTLPSLLCGLSAPVEWSGQSEANRRDFWIYLRLRMPPRDRSRRGAQDCKQPIAQISVTGSNKKKAIRANSHESLEVLV
ncbi:X-linked interleukin-1 receptor accessory protein-like 2 [Anabrus simplex]|uniref:X-linked interleukin-1 receptor accessory protein-like 2 n=1 Tax=Anabrus simplex TaxID=316456 RepID=UPI0035A32136